MRKENIHKILFIAVILTAVSCAKTVIEGPNTAGKRFFEAWMQVNHPGKQPTGLGIYVLEEEPGDSQTTVTEDGYVFVEYISTDLNGVITAYTDSLTAKQLGNYSASAYYGPQPLMTADGTIQAGLQCAMTNMKVNGRKKVVIPSWLMSYSTYSSEQEYLDKATDYSDAIYDFRIVDFTKDIYKWQTDSIGRFFGNDKIDIFIARNKVADVFDGMTDVDSVKQENGGFYGFYYKQVAPPENDKTFPSDTTVYINYTGRLLNGKVFDTTDEKIAKNSGIFNSATTYAPVQINWGESYTDITMGSNSTSVIDGFALTLWQMKSMEKGVGVFYSPLGYGNSGSGSTIPAYAPLFFEIELVTAPEE